jgi:hypothetical protein
MPSTPGTLSLASPTIARRSTNCTGSKPPNWFWKRKGSVPSPEYCGTAVVCVVQSCRGSTQGTCDVFASTGKCYVSQRGGKQCARIWEMRQHVPRSGSRIRCTAPALSLLSWGGRSRGTGEASGFYLPC